MKYRQVTQSRQLYNKKNLHTDATTMMTKKKTTKIINNKKKFNYFTVFVPTSYTLNRLLLLLLLNKLIENGTFELSYRVCFLFCLLNMIGDEMIDQQPNVPLAQMIGPIDRWSHSHSAHKSLAKLSTQTQSAR